MDARPLGTALRYYSVAGDLGRGRPLVPRPATPKGPTVDAIGLADGHAISGALRSGASKCSGPRQRLGIRANEPTQRGSCNARRWQFRPRVGEEADGMLPSTVMSAGSDPQLAPVADRKARAMPRMGNDQPRSRVHLASQEPRNQPPRHGVRGSNRLRTCRAGRVRSPRRRRAGTDGFTFSLAGAATGNTR